MDMVEVFKSGVITGTACACVLVLSFSVAGFIPKFVALVRDLIQKRK